MTDDCTVRCHHQDTIVTSEFYQDSCGIVITSRDTGISDKKGEMGCSVHIFIPGHPEK